MSTPEAISASPEQPGTFRAKAVRGAAWTLGTFILGNLWRLGSNLILTRLLFPEAFGLIALVSTFIQGLQMFSDLGTGVAIVQNPKGDDPKFLDTAWTLQVLRGSVLWAACWLIAWPVSRFYDQSLLMWLIPGAGLTAFLSGFESTAIWSAQRHMQLKHVALMDLFSQISGSLVTILLAYVLRGALGEGHLGSVWAMVAGMVFGSVMRLLLSHSVLPHRRRPHWRLDKEALDAVFRLGRWIFISTVLTFLSGQSDRLIFAKMIPLDLFGVYGIALLLASLPQLSIGHVTRSVALPAYSRVVGNLEDLKGVFSRTRKPLLVAGATLVAGLLACGPLLIRILYDNRYEQAGWILQLLVLATWVQILDANSSMVVLAQGRTNWLAAGSAAKLVCMVGLVPLGYQWDGFRGALMAVVGSEVARYLSSSVAMALQGIYTWLWDLGFSLLVMCTASAGLYAAELLRHQGFGDIVGFFTAGICTAALWAVIALYFWGDARARQRAAATWTPPGVT